MSDGAAVRPPDGGPAFHATLYPTVGIGPRVFDHVGVTVRDYFAAAALPAVSTDPRDSDDCRARRAYAIADAMMRARGRE